ncbi:MAG: phage scaffolding protein, partial [Gordonibacter sp.]|uniref:phage scaffolding protein n=1 Tax=Gordonibacter sp. TaxID=1968902 RepID=UPI002FC6DA51
KPDHAIAADKYKQQRDTARAQAAEVQKQLDDLNTKLAKALTEDDMKAAVEKAKQDSEANEKAMKESWEADRKRLTVENALISAGCNDTVGLIAHLDMANVAVAGDGHISGLDAKELKESYPYLFAGGKTVSSAATPGGAAKKMTKEQIMAIRDTATRQKAIADNMDVFE